MAWFYKAKISKNKTNGNYKLIKNALHIFIMLILSMIVLYLRNHDSLINPIIYAEDGVWVGKALSNGWFNALFTAKQGYLVWGNVILLWLSVFSSETFCGDKLSCLPYTISFYSFFFYSSIAVFCYSLTKSLISYPFRLFLLFFILLLPVGDSSNEIFGRVVNIGYWFVFLTFLLIINRKAYRQPVFATDLILLICAATNVVSLILIPVLLYLKEYYKNNFVFIDVVNFIKNNKLITIGWLLIFVFTIIKIIVAPHSPIMGELNPNNTVKEAFFASLARMFLFPLVFPFYEQLTDDIVLFLTLCLMLFFLFLISMTKKDEARFVIHAAFITYILFFAVVFFTRPKMVYLLISYSSGFPDRYFMGVNVLLVFAFFFLLGRIAKYSKVHYQYCITLCAVFFIYYLFNLNIIFELDDPRMKIANGPDFIQQLCLSEDNNESENLIRVSIHPNSWNMIVPKNEFYSALNNIDCKKKVWDGFFVTDVNWDAGIAKNWTGFYLPNTKYYRSSFKKDKNVVFVDGTTRKIKNVVLRGNFIHIYLAGERLHADKVSNPLDIAVQQEVMLSD